MEGIMTTSPYTHPSMPGTPPMVFDLSAALEDAEGIALVEAIHTRKAHSMKVMVDGKWKDVSATSVELDIPERDLFTEPGRLVPKKMSAAVQMQFQDISHEFMALLLGYSSVEEMREAGRRREELAQMAEHWARTGRSGYRWVYSSGRGYGKVATARAVLAWRKAVTHAPEARHIAGVRWSCPKPTAMPLAKTIMVDGYGLIVPINTPESSVKVTSVNP
jgi:hypothetical protein